MASSPQSYTDPADEGNKKQEQITFRFCSECSNMLYPKEDEQNLKLQFTCRTCQYTEEATSSCIFRNELDTTVHETAGVTQDVSSDPTVGSSPEPVFCLLCGSPVTCLVCGSPVDPNLPDAHQHNAYSVDLTDACSTADSVSTSPFDSLATVLDGSFMDDEFDVDSDIFFNMGEFPDEQPCDYDGDLSMADHPTNFQYHQLPRSKRKCKECGAQEAVYFQSQRRDANTGMTLFYVCCDCGAISK